MDVGSETSESHHDSIIDLEESLEISSDGRVLLSESIISSKSDTIFAAHADERASIVAENIGLGVRETYHLYLIKYYIIKRSDELGM